MLTPDIVFIDTSVFIAENYFASGNRIHTLMQLAEEGKINLVLSEITVKEVRKHIISSTRDAWKQFDKVCKVFRNREEIDKWRKSTNDKKEQQNRQVKLSLVLSVAYIIFKYGWHASVMLLAPI